MAFRITMSVILSIGTAITLVFAFPPSARFVYSQSFFPVLAAAGLFPAFFFGSKRIVERFSGNHREAVITGLLSLLFSLFTVIGANINELSCDLLAVLLIAALLDALPFLCLLEGLWILLDKWRMQPGCAYLPESERTSFSSKLEGLLQKKHFGLAILLILLAAWLPYYLAAFPGFFCYDLSGWKGTELDQWQTGQFINFFPILHVFLLGSLMDLGRSLFGDYIGGVALYTAVQAILLALMFTATICWTRKITGRGGVVIFSLLYYILDPVIGMFVMCDVRDVLFSSLFLTVCISLFNLMEAFKAQSTAGRHRQFLCCCLFVLFGFLFSIARNNGIYAVAVSFPLCLILATKNQVKILVASFAGILLSSFLWYGPFSALIGVEDTNSAKTEGGGIVIQHLAYTSVNGYLTQDEMSYLEDIGYQTPNEDYRTDLADGSKYTIADVAMRDLVPAYFAIGLSHPTAYLKAELLRSQDIWNPYSSITCYNGYNPRYNGRETSFFDAVSSLEENGQYGDITTTRFPALLRMIEKIGRTNMLQEIPFLSLLVSLPFYFWVFLIAVARCLIDWRSNRESLMVLSVFFGIFLTSYLAPTVLPRYFLFFFFGLPILVAILLKAKSIRVGQR